MREPIAISLMGRFTSFGKRFTELNTESIRILGVRSWFNRYDSLNDRITKHYRFRFVFKYSSELSLDRLDLTAFDH